MMDVRAADLFYVTGYLFLVISLFSIGFHFGKRIRYLADAITIMTTLFLLSWTYVIKPIYAQSEMSSALVLIVNLTYPLMDILMLFAIIMWKYKGEIQVSRSAQFWLIMGSLSCIAGDTYFLIVSDIYGYEVNSLIGPLWSLASFAALLAGRSALVTRREDKIVRLNPDKRISYVLPYFGLMILTINPLFRSSDLIYKLGLVVVVGALVMRQILLVAEREKLLMQVNGTLEQTEYMARHDTLTPLLNRRAFSEELHGTIRRAQEQNQKAALYYFDLDGFKPVNDQYGHQVGDLLLSHIAARLSPLIEAEGTCARLGGDEFGVILYPAVSEQHVREVADFLCEELASPFWLDDKEIRVTSSIGIAILDQTQEVTAAEWVRSADNAMYISKRNGGNQATIVAMNYDNCDEIAMKNE
ncbi:diguanylate cyclase (GGDEF)-like protein [Paenibacillus phyllosphaerae]|uniref:Diguanylate cyclase (GGDEF)-like protein n=2 Tax=Paenibacillus phyllosphaerae TaxID=274593 RepID=A0A7W5B471_9BACL|nr:diguanylate cyclase (GGDEF)-like protein [Paenibacillus phyllosphaerae]